MPSRIQNPSLQTATLPEDHLSPMSQGLLRGLDQEEHSGVEGILMEEPEENTASQLGKMGAAIVLLFEIL